MCAGAGLARTCVTRQRQNRIDHIHSCESMLGILPAGLTSVLVSLILLAPYRIGSPGTGVGRCPGQRSEPRQRKVKKKDACFSGSFISQVTRSLTQLLTNTLTSRQTSTDALTWLDWGQVCCWGCVKNSCASFRSVCVARWRRQSLFRTQKLFIIGVHCNDVRQSCVKLKNWHAAFPSSSFFLFVSFAVFDNELT